MSLSRYTKLPSKVQHFLVIHHKSKAPDLYHYFLDPPHSRADKERLHLRLRYYNDIKDSNPIAFDRLYHEAVEFFEATPVTSLSHLSLEKLATLPPKTPPKQPTKTRHTPPRSKAKSSLSFIEPEEDSSEDDFDFFSLPASSKKAATPSKKSSPKSPPKRTTAEMTFGNGITVTPFSMEERKKEGLMTVDYIAVKYRSNSLVDVFQKTIKHTVARDGMSLQIDVPNIDGETKQDILANTRTSADGEETDVLNSVLTKMYEKVGPEYVKALLMQITTAVDNEDETEEIKICFNQKVLPDSLNLHKLPVTVVAETGKHDLENNPKTYEYKVVDFVYVFKVANSERFIKRYATSTDDDDLADAFDDLSVG